MLPVNSSARTTSRPDTLTNGTYAVLGLVMHTMVFRNPDRTVVQPVPLLGRLDENGKVKSVHLVQRSDIGRRLNDVRRSSDNKTFNNTGTFVDKVAALVANTPVGVHPDIYYCLKIFNEIRNSVFDTTEMSVSCLSQAGRVYTAHIYNHEFKSVNANLTSTKKSRDAIQALATARGFGEVYGLDGTFEFCDANEPDTALTIDADACVPAAE